MNPSSTNAFLFYGLKPSSHLASFPAIGPEWAVKICEPRFRVLLSQQLLSKFGIACWAMNWTRVFRNRDCRVLTIRRDGQLVHSCSAHPAFFRYPFMGHNDMQIAKVWTHPDFRANKLARYGVHMLLSELQLPGRTLWYVVAKSNIPSIRVAEAIGLELLAEGKLRRSNLGRLWDQYIIMQPSTPQVTGHAA